MTQARPVFVARSSETGTDYRVYVDPPAAPGPWAGVLLMDGDFMFDAAVRESRGLQAAGRIPPTAVVGVGYGAGFGAAGNHRGRDYTPTAAPEEPSSGGADRFLAFLAGELWPELARRYPLRAGGRAIAGHSLGSLLVLHALFQPRPFFDLALASAPSIWWDGRSILALISSLRDRQAALAGRLFLGVGEEDSPSMTGDLVLLESQLAARPFAGLTVHSRRFPGRDHYTSLPDGMRAGLADLLGPAAGASPPPPGAAPTR
jgi:predicted alpha/beta superfamily hydrolase